MVAAEITPAPNARLPVGSPPFRVLEGLGETLQLALGHAQGAAVLARAAHGAFHFPQAVRNTLKAAELKSLSDHFRNVPDYRRPLGQYPLFALLGMCSNVQP